MVNIYFICTGNTCRSPMAEAILKSKNLKNVEVRSAGIYAQDGSAMSDHAKAVLDQANIKHDHTASLFSYENVQWADVLLTMTAAHKAMILRSIPDGHEKVFTLKEYVLSTIDEDIQDPYGGSLEIYEQTFKELNDILTELEKKLELGGD